MSPLLNANAAELASLEALSRKAEAFQARITLPVLETTPDAVTAAADKVIADAEAALDRIGAQDLSAVTFASTLKAYDRVVFDVRSAAYRFGLLKDAHPDKAMRDAAEAAAVKIASWGIGVEYREDLYRVVRAFADSQPTLEGEDRRLLDHTLRDYRRAGLALPEAERREVERLRKELTELTSQFSSNVVAATGPMILTAEEVAGIPQRFLDSPGIRQDDGTYKVMLNVTWHWEAVMVNATDPDVRRRAHVIRFSLAKDANIPLMAKIVATRTATTRLMSWLLGAVATISLIVGGIGIMNIMLVSVTERIREIGLRMAVGAGPSDIRRQFLAEAMLLSLGGGLLGILIGVAGALLVGQINSELPVELNGKVIALAAGFSIATGLFFGYYPARKASQLDPIEALRQQ